MDVPSYLQRPFEYVPHPSDDDLIRKGKYEERSRIRQEQEAVIAEMTSVVKEGLTGQALRGPRWSRCHTGT